MTGLPKRPARLPSNPEKTYDLGFKNGAEHGFGELQHEILSFLEDRYMGENRPDRGTLEAKAILVLAGELSDHMKELKLGKIG